MFLLASVSLWPNPAMVHGHASVRHQSWCFIPLSTALLMKSVTVVMVAVEEVCAHRRLAKDAVTSNKFWLGTLKREFKVNWELVRASERESEIVERTAGPFS